MESKKIRILDLASLVKTASCDILLAALLFSTSFCNSASDELEARFRRSNLVWVQAHRMVMKWINYISALGGDGFRAMSHLYNLLNSAGYEFNSRQLTEMLAAYANVPGPDLDLEIIFKDLLGLLRKSEERQDILTELAGRMKGKDFLVELLLPEVVASNPPLSLMQFLRCLKAKPIAQIVMREIESREDLASEISSIAEGCEAEVCALLMEALMNSKIREGAFDLLGKFGLLTEERLAEIGEIPGCRNLVKRWIRERKNL